MMAEPWSRDRGGSVVEPLALGLGIVGLIAVGGFLLWNALLWRGCVFVHAPVSTSVPPIKSFVSSGVVRGLELAAVRTPAGNTSGTRSFQWQGKTLDLDVGERFFVKKADVVVMVMGTYHMEGAPGPSQEIQHYAVNFEVAESERDRFQAWIGARSGRSVAMLTGGVPIIVAQMDASVAASSLFYTFSLTGPGETGWTLDEAIAIASTLCP